MIRRVFRRDDPIGITFVAQGVAAIFLCIFLGISGTVLVLRDLFQEDTVSFIPLCSIASVEMGCALVNASGSPMKISPAE